MAMSSADLAPSTMPEEAPQLGDGTSFKAQQQAYAQAGPPSQGGASPPPGGAPPAPQPGQPPVQPGPERTPLTQDDVRPGGPIFSAPKFAPYRGWRQEMKIMAAHPDGGPWLGAMRKKIEDEEAQTGKLTKAP